MILSKKSAAAFLRIVVVEADCNSVAISFLKNDEYILPSDFTSYPFFEWLC